MAEKYRVKGAIFENQKAGPAFTGVIEIDGEKIQLALWAKTSAAGKPYYQISEDKKGKDQGHPAAPVRNQFSRPAPQRPIQGSGHPSNDMDDDIPFAPEFR